MSNKLTGRGEVGISQSLEGTLGVARWVLLFIFVLGIVGTLAELYLLRHTGGPYELIPLVLVALTFPVLAWNVATRSLPSRRAMQLLMGGYLLSGAIGSWFHFSANVGYEQESNPGLALGEVYKLAIAGSTPTLAPGTMIMLGMVGLLFLFLQSHSNRGIGSSTPNRIEP